MTSGLHIKKINPPVAALGRLGSPPYNARNGALPPIGSYTAMELEPHPRYQVSLPHPLMNNANVVKAAKF